MYYYLRKTSNFQSGLDSDDYKNTLFFLYTILFEVSVDLGITVLSVLAEM